MAKVYKKDLKNFLENQQEKMLRKESERFEKEVFEGREKHYQATKKIFFEQQEELKKIYDKLVVEKENIETIYSWSSTPFTTIIRHIEVALGCFNSTGLYANLVFPGYQNIVTRHEKKVDEIIEEYNHVKTIVSSLSPKKGAEFLEELGFNINHLYQDENEPVVALTTTINTKTLGIGE